jgi:hypothetical protein
MQCAVPFHVDGVSEVAVNSRKHGDDRAALMVVGCIIDLFANRKLRHREPLLESSTPNLNRVVDAWVSLMGRSKPGRAERNLPGTFADSCYCRC